MRKSLLLRLPVFCSLLTLVTLLGCSSSAMPAAGTVRGVVKYKGEPVSGGNVIFHPEAGGPTSAALIGPDGKYFTYDVKPGLNKVTVVAGDPKSRPLAYPGQTIPKSAVVKDAPADQKKGATPAPPKPTALPGKYSKTESSNLSFTVKQNSENEYNIELTD